MYQGHPGAVIASKSFFFLKKKEKEKWSTEYVSKATSRWDLVDKTRKRVEVLAEWNLVLVGRRGVRGRDLKKRKRDDRGSLKVAACGWFGVAKHAH